MGQFCIIIEIPGDTSPKRKRGSPTYFFAGPQRLKMAVSLAAGRLLGENTGFCTSILAAAADFRDAGGASRNQNEGESARAG